MSHRTPAIALAFVAGTTLAAAAFAQSAPAPDNGDPLTRSRELPEYTASGSSCCQRIGANGFGSASH